jgi:chaperonin GroES
MKFKPLHDRVLVRRIEEEITHGGIVIPDQAKEKPSRGKVIAIGPGKQLDDGTLRPLTVKEGDTVIFGKYSGNEVKVNNIDYIVMREDDIMGIEE